MAPLGVVYWVCWAIWNFFGWRRNYPTPPHWAGAGGDIVQVIILLIIGLALFPPHL